MKKCVLCPRLCRVNRLAGEKGRCESGAGIRVASVNIHFDEEPPISGETGSGAVFFSGCGLRCIFCQNFPLSHGNAGNDVSSDELAGRFLDLQRRRAHNINLVTGTQFVPGILEAISKARGLGMMLPVVWNTGGYERVETLKLLDGSVDIYLADYKFSSSRAAEDMASAPDYPEVAEAALREMAGQVGSLDVDENGIAVRGLIVRHLVLPGNLSGTQRVIDFVERELPRGVALSLMSQYTPYGRARTHRLLGRRLWKREYRQAVKYLERSGIREGWTQDM